MKQIATLIILLFPQLLIAEDLTFKEKLRGNTWMFGAAYDFTPARAFSFDFGRNFGEIYGGGGAAFITVSTYGVGVEKPTSSGQLPTYFKLFYQAEFVPLLWISFRTDLLTNSSFSDFYLRPGAGFSFFFGDLHYNYSFHISGNEINPFKHGLTLRFKIFPFWQEQFEEHNSK